MLYAEPVSRERDRPRVRIEIREPEHAARALEAAQAFCRDQPKQHLGIRTGREGHAFGLENRADVAIIVDLTVEDDVMSRDPHRLIASGEIDDRETLKGEHRASCLDHDESVGVRTSMLQCSRARLQERALISREGTPKYSSDKTTHSRMPLRYFVTI